MLLYITPAINYCTACRSNIIFGVEMDRGVILKYSDGKSEEDEIKFYMILN